MADFQEILYSRASIRAFTDAELSDEQLTELVRAGLAAPWAFHDHARHLCVIAGLGRPGYNMYAPAAAILACVERGNDNQKLEVGCMLENIFLRATDMGIGSCWINQARDICDDARVRPVLRAFGVPDTHVCWGIAIVGYAAAAPRAQVHQEGTYNIYH